MYSFINKSLNKINLYIIILCYVKYYENKNKNIIILNIVLGFAFFNYSNDIN